MSKWQDFKELVFQRFDWTKTVLADGATNQALSDFEKELGLALPEMFRAIYSQNKISKCQAFHLSCRCLNKT